MLSFPVSYKILKKRPHLKYHYFFKMFIKNGGKFCFDFTETSFGRLSGPKKLFTPLIIIEIILWIFLNKIPFSRICFFPPKGSKIIVFTYKGATEMGSLKKRNFQRACQLYWHLSHYMILTKEKSNFIRMFKDKSTFLADSDLRENNLFNIYFSDMKDRPLLLIPFVPAERFICSTSFQDRIDSKIYATGTYHLLSRGIDNCDDALDVFKVNCHHYLRSEIASNKFDWIVNSQGNFKEQVGLNKSNYFKKDLVEEFNRYAFIVCGDELNGLPAISNFEAMCCGAMPIIKEENYKGLGLQKGVHYLTHDGTIQGLLEVFESSKSNAYLGFIERKEVREILKSHNDLTLKKIWE